MIGSAVPRRDRGAGSGASPEEIAGSDRRRSEVVGPTIGLAGALAHARMHPATACYSPAGPGSTGPVWPGAGGWRFRAEGGLRPPMCEGKAHRVTIGAHRGRGSPVEVGGRS